MTLIVTKGTLDWAYPPFILATTAAAMGVDVTMFFTFYGLPLLLKKLDLEVTPLGNPAMKMPPRDDGVKHHQNAHGPPISGATDHAAPVTPPIMISQPASHPSQ